MTHIFESINPWPPRILTKSPTIKIIRLKMQKSIDMHTFIRDK